jgi:hypothetical protein
MAYKQKPSIVDFLNVIDPRQYMSDEEAELDEDRTIISKESEEVYKFMFRCMEQWKFLPVERRDGGIIKGAYMGEIDDEYEAAQQMIKLLEQRFGRGRKIDDEPVFSRYKSQNKTDEL